jgi:hypothetical protein
MGATDTFLSKVSSLAPTLNSGYLLTAAILLQIPANYIYLTPLDDGDRVNIHQHAGVDVACGQTEPRSNFGLRPSKCSRRDRRLR